MNQADKEIELEKLRTEIVKTKTSARYNLLIAFIGTFLVSVTGSYLVFLENTTKDQQNFQQNTEKNAQVFDDGHRQFIASFVDIAIDNDIERRQRLARYFATVTLDEEQKSRWEDYALYVEKLIDENPSKIAQLKDKLKNPEEKDREALEARIKFLESQLNSSAKSESNNDAGPITKLKLERFVKDEDSTIGRLFGATDSGDIFLSFTLENSNLGKRVPAGEYEIILRNEGFMHERYSAKWGEMHKGMLMLKDVPDMEFVSIHVGNTSDDTIGSILVGENAITAEGQMRVNMSRIAYSKIYEHISAAILLGRRVTIRIVDVE